MIRGTTAQFEFKLPYSKNDIRLAEVKFLQPGNTKGLEQDYPLPLYKVYQKEAYDEFGTQYYPWNWLDDYTLIVNLEQRETLTFSDKYKAQVQCRAQTVDGQVFASVQQNINVYPASWDRPIGNDATYIVLDGDNVKNNLEGQLSTFDGDVINGGDA